MKPRIVVLGSTGMAGHMISAYLEEQGFTVYRISRSEKNTNNTYRIDVVNFEALKICLDKVQPTLVINCIGLLQKGCEVNPALAVLVNSYLPHFLEEIFKFSDVKIIHLSTDCVFSGLKGKYKEDDVKDGNTYYDQTKALGEINNNKDLTLRMSIIGPDIDNRGTGLLNWFMQQSGTVFGYTGALWNGITTLELSETIEYIINEQYNLSGIYHLVPDGYISKYDLLQEVKLCFGKNDVTIYENSDVIIDKTLVNTRKDLVYEVKAYKQQIQLMYEWLNKHRGIYQEYYYNKN